MADKETQVEAKQQASERTSTEGTPEQAKSQDKPYEIAYTTKEVTELLGVVSSTVRKYSIALEDEGYTILRNALDRRIFTDKDVAILRNVKELIAAGTTVEKAVKIAMQDRQDRSDNAAGSSNIVESDRNGAVAKLMEYIEHQAEESAKTTEELHQLHRKLDYVIDELQTLKAEAKVATQADAQGRLETQTNVEPEGEPEKKKSLLSRLFKL